MCIHHVLLEKMISPRVLLLYWRVASGVIVGEGMTNSRRFSVKPFAIRGCACSFVTEVGTMCFRTGQVLAWQVP